MAEQTNKQVIKDENITCLFTRHLLGMRHSTLRTLSG